VKTRAIGIIGQKQQYKEMMVEEKKFYTIQEASGMLGISEAELMKHIDNKEIPVLKVGRALRISGESIDSFLDGTGEYDDEVDNGSLEAGLEEVFSKDIMGLDEEDIVKTGEAGLRLKKLQDECEKLINKKQELEEDINYLQIEYEEFRTKIKKLVVEELKTFLKKVDNGKIDLEERSFKE
jgi:excisionase family DNA binding protein